MRVICAAIAVLIAACGVDPAAAQTTYPWCAVYGGNGDSGGGENCGFSTLPQCMATVSGVGGFCRQSSWYTGPVAQPATRSKKRH
jgi:hypothetical protein